MNKLLHRTIFILLIMINFTKLAAQNFDDELEKTKKLIVMLRVEFDGSPEFGAGIIIGREKDELLIATAYHVIHRGIIQPKSIHVTFRTKPDQFSEATVLKYSNEDTMDLALLSVKNLSKEGIDICSVQFDRLGKSSSLERGDEVFPLGNPNGTPWAIPVEADKVADILEDKISFQSTFINRGHSGGPLLDDSAGIAGLIIADEGSFGRAINMDNIINKINQWGYRVQLRGKDYEGQTPLHLAAKEGDITSIKKLLTDCYDVNQRDDHKATPLHFAAAYATPEVITLLINAGADINALDADGDPPLEWADETKSVENVKFLVNHGALWRRWTPLIYSAIKDDTIAIHNSLSNKENFMKRDDHQATPLHYACCYASTQIVRMMIEAGADINAHDENDDPPIMWAVESDRLDIIKLLLKLNLDNNKCELRRGLLESAIKNGQFKSLKFLLSSKADEILHEDCSFRPEDDTNHLLATAIKYRQIKMIEFFLNEGATGSGFPLVSAVASGDKEITKLLVQSGADINVCGDCGSDTPCDCSPDIPPYCIPLDLIFTRKWESDFLLEMLKIITTPPKGKSNAVIHPYHVDGMIAFFSIGIIFQNELDKKTVLEAAKILIAAGADVNNGYIIDNEYMTPLALALEYGYTATAQYLREHGAKK